MPRVTYTAESGRYRVVNHTFTPGDTHPVSDELAGHLADHDQFEVLDDAGGDDVHEEDGPPDGHLTRYHPSDLTVDEINEKLDSFDYEALELEKLAEEEREGKDRTTAIEAIEDRLADLEE